MRRPPVHLRVVLVALALVGCTNVAPLDPAPAPTATAEARAAGPAPVEGSGEGVVNSVDRTRAFPFSLPGPSSGVLAVALTKTSPTDAVYWDIRDAADETVVFGRAGAAVARDTDETFEVTIDVEAAADYRLLIDHDQVGTPGPVAFRLSWEWLPASQAAT